MAGSRNFNPIDNEEWSGLFLSVHSFCPTLKDELARLCVTRRSAFLNPKKFSRKGNWL